MNNIGQFVKDNIFSVFGTIVIIMSAFLKEDFVHTIIRFSVIAIGIILLLIGLVIFLKRAMGHLLDDHIERGLGKLKQDISLINIQEKYESIKEICEKNAENMKEFIKPCYTFKNSNLFLDKVPHVPPTMSVAFRAESIQMIFESFSNKQAELDDKLRKIGEKIAVNFINEIWVNVDKAALTHKKDPDSQTLVKAWSDMETTSGWGTFNFEPNNKPGGKTYNGQITVTNCFLSYRNCNQGNKLCCFLCGYMEKIISTITKFPVEVNVDDECGRGNNTNERKCWFNFKYNPRVR